MSPVVPSPAISGSPSPSQSNSMPGNGGYGVPGYGGGGPGGGTPTPQHLLQQQMMNTSHITPAMLLAQAQQRGLNPQQILVAQQQLAAQQQQQRDMQMAAQYQQQQQQQHQQQQQQQFGGGSPAVHLPNQGYPGSHVNSPQINQPGYGPGMSPPAMMQNPGSHHGGIQGSPSASVLHQQAQAVALQQAQRQRQLQAQVQQQQMLAAASSTPTSALPKRLQGSTSGLASNQLSSSSSSNSGRFRSGGGIGVPTTFLIANDCIDGGSNNINDFNEDGGPEFDAGGERLMAVGRFKWATDTLHELFWPPGLGPMTVYPESTPLSYRASISELEAKLTKLEEEIDAMPKEFDHKKRVVLESDTIVEVVAA